MKMRVGIIFYDQEKDEYLVNVFYGDIVFHSVAVKKIKGEYVVFEAQTYNRKKDAYYKAYQLPFSIKIEILEKMGLA